MSSPGTPAQTSGKPGTPKSELGAALAACRHAFIGTAAMSMMLNLLYLTGSFFMLEVYDRVIPGRSIPTLVGLAIIAATLYAFQGVLDVLRARVLSRVGNALDESLSGRVYDVMTRLPLKTRSSDGMQPLRDLDAVRSFLSGPGPGALFDLPWMPLYLGICFIFHPLIGIAASIGALILVSITIMTDRLTRGPVREASGHGAQRAVLAEASRRNAEVLHAMGMGTRVGAAWRESNAKYMASNLRASDIAGGFGAASKVLRMALQSGILALGAYLVIYQQASGGIIIASSIITSRALAPVELAIANWKGFVAARQAWKRLNDLLTKLPAQDQPMQLPPPASALLLESVSVAPPGHNAVVVQDASFKIEAGHALGVVGPSASGKSSLARAIVGAWTPVRGKVRLDGAGLEQWSSERLGRHVGYLPQGVELFAGTVAQNIARFEPEPDPAEDHRGRQGGRRPRHDPSASRRLRDPDRRVWRRPLGRPAPARRARPRALRRPLPHRSRRAQLQSRRRGRRCADPRHPRRTGTRRRRHRHRPPAERAGKRRPRDDDERGQDPDLRPEGRGARQGAARSGAGQGGAAGGAAALRRQGRRGSRVMAVAPFEGLAPDPHREASKPFPLGDPVGAGPLIGWARAASPTVDPTPGQPPVQRGLTQANGAVFDGTDSGFFGAASGYRIWLWSEGPLVVGREGAGGAEPDAGGEVALAFGLDNDCLAMAYYKKIKHADTADPAEMARLMVGLMKVSAAPSTDAGTPPAAELIDPPAAAVSLPPAVAAVIESASADGQAGNGAPAARARRPLAPAAAAANRIAGWFKPRDLASGHKAPAALPAGLVFPGAKAAPATPAHSSIRRHLRAAIVFVLLLAVGVGGWAATTELSGAVIANGQLVVNSNVKKVQHPEGGIVASLDVKDGDRVTAGDVLLTLDGTETRASLGIILKALDELTARKAREEAERDGLQSVVFPADLLARVDDPAVKSVVDGEERLFGINRDARNGEKAQLREQVSQLEEQVRGMNTQLDAKSKEIDWNAQELEGIRELYKKQLTDFSRLTAAERDAARLEGEQGALISSIAEAKGKIAEIELRVLQVDEDMRTEVGKDLADIRGKMAELVEKKTAAEDRLRRLDLRAPQGGVVHQLDVHTIGGVIKPGDTIMDIVPDTDSLTAEVKVPPQEIDQIRFDQAAILQFSAFNQQTTPQLNGKVTLVSADVSMDQKTGANYYLVRVGVSPEEIARLNGLKLVPGMPVEVFIQTKPRTMISYLVRPIHDQIERAFRER